MWLGGRVRSRCLPTRTRPARPPFCSTDLPVGVSFLIPTPSTHMHTDHPHAHTSTRDPHVDTHAPYMHVCGGEPRGARAQLGQVLGLPRPVAPSQAPPPNDGEGQLARQQREVCPAAARCSAGCLWATRNPSYFHPGCSWSAGPLRSGAAVERDAVPLAGAAGGPQRRLVSVPAEGTAVWPRHLQDGIHAVSPCTLLGGQSWGWQASPGRGETAVARALGSLVSVGR